MRYKSLLAAACGILLSATALCAQGQAPAAPWRGAGKIPCVGSDGSEGQKNAIIAGCDTIEHAFGLDQEQANMMVAKGLYYDPPLVRYTEPYMDDNDAKNTGGKFRMIPIFEKAVSMAAATKGMKIMMGSGADGETYVHGTQALDFEALVKHGGLTPVRAIQAGTVVNAEALGWQHDIGSIEKG